MVNKIIKLTESDLTKLVSRVIKEQSKVMMDKVVSSSSSSPKPKVMTDKVVSSSKGFNTIASCASMGVKSPGQCDTQGKKPVKSCASLGVKTPGYCYVDTKKPVPNMTPKGKGSIKEQAAAATGQSVPQNTTGNDRIANLANMMRSLQTKQVPQKVIVAPGSKLNGTLWTDYLKQFKITKEELAQANALLSKLGANPGPVAKPTPATTGTTPQKPMGGAKPTGGAPLTPQQIKQQRIQRRQQIGQQ